MTRRRAIRILAAAGALAALALLAALVGLKPWLQEQVRGRVVNALERLPGCAARLDEVAVQVVPLRVILRGLALDCPDSGSLRVAVVSADIPYRPLLAGRLQVSKLEIRDPRLRLHGPLPLPAAGEGSGAADRLRIGALRLTGGRVDYHSQDPALRWQAEGLAAASRSFLDRHGRLAAAVTVAGSTLDWNGKQVAGLGGRVDLSWQGGVLRIASAQARAAGIGEVRLIAGRVGEPGEAPGGVNPGAGLPYEMEGTASLQAKAARAWMDLPAGLEPVGELAWEGRIRGRGGEWEAEGSLTASGFNVRGLQVSGLAAQPVTLAPTSAAFAGLQARLLASRATGSVRLEQTLPEAAWRLEGEGRIAAADLSALPREWPWPEGVPRPGSLLDLSASGTVPLGAPAAARLAWEMRLAANDAGSARHLLQPQGRLSGRLAAETVMLDPGGHLQLGEVWLRPGGEVGLDGRLNLEAELGVDDLGAAVGRWLPHLPALAPAAGWHPAGRLQWDGSATGSALRPVIEGRATGTDLQVAGWPLGRAAGRLRYADGTLTLEGVQVEGPVGRLHVEALLAVDGRGPIQATWQAEHLDLAALAAHAGWPVALAGSLSGAGSLESGAAGPVLAGRLAGQDLAVAGRDLGAVVLAGAVSAGGLRLEEARLAVDTGEVLASGTLPWRGDGALAEGLSLHAEGISVAWLAGWQGLSGTLAARGRLAGSFQAPRIVDPLTYEVNGLRWREAPLMDLAGEATSEADRLHFQVKGREPDLSLEVVLDLTPAGLSTASLRLGAMELPVPVPAAGVQLRVAGARASVAGRLADLQSLTTEVEVSGVVLASPGGVLEMRRPLRIVGTGPDLTLAPVAFAVGPQEITLQGSARLGDPVSYRLQMEGTSDLQAWQPFTTPLEGAGNLALNVTVVGEGARLELTGGAELTAGYFRLPDFPHALEGVYARAELEAGRVELAEMRGNLGGGRLEGAGTIQLSGLSPGEITLELRGERVRLRYPEGVTSTSNFDLRLQGTTAQSRLTGQVSLVQGRYEEDLHMERRIVSPLPPELPPSPGPLDRVLLDLDLEAPGNLWIDNDFARAEFQADLQLRGTAARPVLEGPVELVRAGRVTFQDVRYELVGATAAFSAAHPNDPELDLQAQTTKADHTVTLAVSGRLSDLRFSLSAEPELSREEIVALLITGRVPRGDEQIQVSPQLLSSYLGGALAPVSRTLTRVSGVDEARIDPVFVEGQSDPTARLTLTERLSSKLSASWSTLLGSAQGDTVDLRYRVLPHLELRTAREDDGSTAAEARYIRSYFTRGERSGEREPEVAASGATVEADFLVIEGAPDPPGEAALRKALNFRPGQRLASSDLLAAAAEARWVLVQAGYRLARIGCHAAEGPRDQAPAPVTCSIEAGPRIELVISGALNKSEALQLRRAVDEAWMELISDAELVETAVSAAREFYRNQGRMRVAVEGGRSQEDDAILVTLDVRPGPRVRATRVALEGVETLDAEEVLSHLALAGRDLLRHRLLTPALLRQDREALRRLHAAAGFLDVRVAPPDVSYPKPGEATVTFKVVEGPRLPLLGIEFQGNERWTDAELREKLSPPTRGHPDAEALEKVAAGLRDLYDGQGRPDASVVWHLAREAQGVRVIYEIQEGSAVQIGAIRLEGNRLTDDDIIRRELRLEPGEPFRRRDLFAAQKRVRDLDLFRSVVIQGEPSGEDGVRDVVLRVQERDNLELAVGAGFDDEEGVRLSFSLGNRNLLGRAGSASFQGRWSEELRFAALRGGWRRVGGSRSDLLGSVGIREEEREGFTERRDTLVMQISRPWSARTTLLGRYRLEDVTLSDVLLPPEQVVVTEEILASLGASWIRKTLDDPFNPRDGGFRSIDLSVYSDLLGSESEFTKLFLQQSHFSSFGERRLVYSVASRLGFAWPFNDTPDVPLSERFFAGGISSVRGYKQDRLGPVDPATGTPLGGASVFVLNQEVRIPLTERLSLHFFLDGGNVFPGAGDLDLGDLKYSVGPGFSYRTPAGPLRLYYGWKLDREAGEDAARFHVTFGPVF